MFAERVSWPFLAVLLGAACVWQAAPASADPVPIGGEFLVNSIVAGPQQAPTVAISASGALVSVWQGPESGGGDGIWTRLYDAGGSPLATEFLANTTSAGDQTEPVVASRDNGDFVVAWQGPDAGNGTLGIFARRYLANGTAVTSEIAVNATVAGEQIAPAVAYGESGNFLVVWQSQNQDGSGEGIYGRLFDGGGSPLTGELLINSTIVGDQLNPAIAVTEVPVEMFAVVWEGSDGSGNGVFIQRLDAAGAPLGSETLVNSGNTTGDQRNSAVAISGISQGDIDRNRITVVWQGPGASMVRIFFRLFLLSGAPDGGPKLVDDDPVVGDQIDPSVSMSDSAPEGFAEFIATWSQFEVAREILGQNIFIVGARRPRSAVRGTNPEFAVSVDGTQTGRSNVSVAPTLDFVVVWQSDNQDGSGEGVYARRFDANILPLFADGFETGSTGEWSSTLP